MIKSKVTIKNRWKEDFEQLYYNNERILEKKKWNLNKSSFTYEVFHIMKSEFIKVLKYAKGGCNRRTTGRINNKLRWKSIDRNEGINEILKEEIAPTDF